MVCELLAIKLLKEYSTRELIDALSYGFFPLQGLDTPGLDWEQRNRPKPPAARISTLEVAIRASAKRFLAHPLVVKQLEAIWAGTVVFHSAADNLHRPQAVQWSQAQRFRQTNESRQHLKTSSQGVGYGTNTPQPQSSPDKRHQQPPLLTRRTVTLYDPRDASLFKLSRLRVPRYRQFFSTCSLAILLGLFVAVLGERSVEITPLEIVFWFWSAGFMLDEVVGFNEQGFSLYLMSFWNIFDLGILLLLAIYYSMRLCGLFLLGVGREDWNSMAYDVLAANAILLFPRLFSVLDHYRYFSQLLIAFRLMAIDLVAVFVLILIACSGFFVAFTMSFGRNDYDAAGVAYKIFQILMGFTPAAWEAWETYNTLGKAILVLFLFICHFLVVTILITVLTNSFMAIVSNANEEHQFVFAVNTISMVKNDALFSYVAPTNILAWLLTPLRFCLPFRTFIKLNRTVIKVTHFPLLFGIYAYEKIFLARSVFEPTDLVDNMGRVQKRLISFQETRPGLFSPNLRMRQDSVAGFQKDRALDEVFRLAPRGNFLRDARNAMGERETHNAVNNWIDHQGGGIASSLHEHDPSVVDRFETRRQGRNASMFGRRGISRDISGTRSVMSDPADFMSTSAFHDPLQPPDSELRHVRNYTVELSDADGDDELVSNDEDEGETLDKRTGTNRSRVSDSENEKESEEDCFQTPTAVGSGGPLSSSTTSSRKLLAVDNLTSPKPSPSRQKHHARNMSTNTILYNPVVDHHSSSASPPRSRPLTAKHRSTANTGTHTPMGSGPKTGHRTPRHSIYTTTSTKPRPIMPARQQFHSSPNANILDSAHSQQLPQRPMRHRHSSLDMGMSELGLDGTGPVMVPNSFATQMAMATGGLKNLKARDEDTEGMMGRLMLARMKTLEEGFAEMVKELRGIRTAGYSSNEGMSSKLKGKEKVEKGGGREKSKNEPNNIATATKVPETTGKQRVEEEEGINDDDDEEEKTPETHDTGHEGE